MSAPLDHAGPLEAVEDPGPPLLVVGVRVEVCRPELLGPFEETTR
jgi:hypothetical protein